MKKSPIILALLLVWACASVLAMAPAQLDTIVQQRIADPTLKGAQIGILVQSLDDGSTWYTRNAGAPFVPASNTKVITAILALELLRPEYRYATRVFAGGLVTDGVLQGDLYVQGGGDPSLTSDDLREIAHTLATGDAAHNIPPIKAVHGRLLLDESFFPQPGPLRNADWETSDLPWYYAAPAGALSVNRNAVTVTVRGTKSGKLTKVILTPPTKLFTIRNSSVTSTRVRTGAVQVSPQGRQINISGNVAPGAELTEKLSVPNPARYLEEQFRNVLQAEGITIGDTATGTVDPQQQSLLIEHRSAPLSDIIANMLKESDNHTAEQLRWTLLSLYSLEKPLDVRYQAMLQDFAAHSGLTAGDISLTDGSGLSRGNHITPDAMVRMLRYMALSPDYNCFFQALPVAGVDGTLKTRMTNGPATCKVHAKTGTMRSVSTLAGYLTTANNERLVFAVFVNGYKRGASAARKLQDDIVCYLAGCNAETAPAAPAGVQP